MGKRRTQLAFDIDPELKALIKISAIKRNISMHLWLNRAIYKELIKEGCIRPELKKKDAV